eukprot:GILI01009060.1.p1 GENE.GILI01009060.1~~GILI01009060.1.p1  ORF type:complete len:384 (-),score=54.71 GILI01009060.1:67-1218(-)
MVVKTVDQRVVVRSTETNFERFVSGHTRSARDAIFLSNQTVVSGSDDTTVRMWDIISQTELSKGTIHRDYVRTLCPFEDGQFVSGSYDHTVQVWDGRKGLETPVIGFTADGPVEKVIYIPSHNMIGCSAADVVYLFDSRNSATPLFTVSNHTKAVTALAYSAQHDTLLTGSLDLRVNFVSLSGSEPTVVASKKHTSPVTALAVHPHGDEYCVGFSSGMYQSMKIELSAREDDSMGDASKARTHKERSEISTHKYLLAVRIALSRFRYQRALHTALLSKIDDVIVSTLEELMKRGALRVALANQNDRSIVSMLKFSTRFVSRPAYTNLCLAVIDVVLEIYAGSAANSPYLHRQFLRTQKTIGATLSNLSYIRASLGVMDLIAAI